MSDGNHTITRDGIAHTFTRKEALATIWRHTHNDFRGKSNGVRTILVYREGTTLIDLDSLTHVETEEKLAGVLHKELARRAKRK